MLVPGVVGAWLGVLWCCLALLCTVTVHRKPLELALACTHTHQCPTLSVSQAVSDGSVPSRVLQELTGRKVPGKDALPELHRLLIAGAATAAGAKRARRLWCGRAAGSFRYSFLQCAPPGARALWEGDSAVWVAGLPMAWRPQR